MRSMIYQVATRPGAGATPVAGRPLVARQIQWLRAEGCEQIVVEVGTDSGSDGVARWLEGDALGAFVRVLLTRGAIGPREVARRSGLGDDHGFVALPGDVFGSTDLARLVADAGRCSVVVRLVPPAGLRALRRGFLFVVGDPTQGTRLVEGAGWGARIVTLDDAIHLGAAALSGRLPARDGAAGAALQIHGAEITPGVWVGRGARIAACARLVAPVFVGADAVICASARLGPAAFVGDRAVVEQQTSLSYAVVAPGTIVGAGLEIRHAHLAPSTVTPTGLRAEPVVVDSLTLTSRAYSAPASVPSRFVAFVAVLALAGIAAPWLALRALRGRPSIGRTRVAGPDGPLVLHRGVTGVAIIDALPALLDVVLGRRAWVGVGAAPVSGAHVEALLRCAALAPYGVIDIEAALVPHDADDAARLRARAWYAHARTGRLDLELLLRTLRARAAR